jgi:hypothetical protein
MGLDRATEEGRRAVVTNAAYTHDGDGTRTRYLYGHGCLGEVRAGTLAYYLVDGQGYVRQTTDPAGAVVISAVGASKHEQTGLHPRNAGLRNHIHIHGVWYFHVKCGHTDCFDNSSAHSELLAWGWPGIWRRRGALSGSFAGRGFSLNAVQITASR